jgi:predicted MFS family arabinose efflux permease
LSSLYVLSFIDRLILALLVAPLRSDLGLSDVQLGLLFGPTFGVFYAVLGLPLARFADQGNRRRLIVSGVVLWGLSTIASGFAATFAELVMLRHWRITTALLKVGHALLGDVQQSKQETVEIQSSK